MSHNYVHLGAVFLSVLLLFGCGAQTLRVPAAAPGIVGPDFSANRFDGGDFHFSSVRGKVVVLNVWAAWCEGCEKDLPLLDEMALRLGKLGVKVLAVSLDSDRVRLNPIVKSRKWMLTMLHDPSGHVGDLYQPSKMPAVYLIDRTGTVRFTHIGMRPEEIPIIESEARSLTTPIVNQF